MEDADFLQTAVTGCSPEGWPRRPLPWARRCRRRRCPSCRFWRRPFGFRHPPAHWFPRRRYPTRRPASGSCPACRSCTGARRLIRYAGPWRRAGQDPDARRRVGQRRRGRQCGRRRPQGDREDRHEGHRRSRQWNPEGHGWGYRSSDWPVKTPRGRSPVLGGVALQNRNSGRATAGVFCVGTRALSVLIESEPKL